MGRKIINIEKIPGESISLRGYLFYPVKITLRKNIFWREELDCYPFIYDKTYFNYSCKEKRISGNLFSLIEKYIINHQP